MGFFARLARAISEGLGGTPPPRRKHKAGAKPASTRRRRPASIAAPKAAPRVASQAPLVRIQALAAKGGRRSEAEDRELARLMKGVQFNPGSRRSARRRNPDADGGLAKAKRISQRFHGSKAQVYELGAGERRGLPRYVVAIGDLEAVDYRPDKWSKRHGSTWRHASGDTGGFTAKRGRPLLVVDPSTMRPAIVTNRSGQRFSSARGIVG